MQRESYEFVTKIFEKYWNEEENLHDDIYGNTNSFLMKNDSTGYEMLVSMNKLTEFIIQ